MAGTKESAPLPVDSEHSAPPAQPDVPAVSAPQPNVPAVATAQSDVVPTAPAAEDTVYFAKPAVPRALPAMPKALPAIHPVHRAVPAARPEIFPAQPSVSAAETGVPAAQPDVAAAQPDVSDKKSSGKRVSRKYLTPEQQQAAKKIFQNANCVTRLEKIFILQFMAGCMDNPCSHLGHIATIKLGEHRENVKQSDGTFVTMVAEMHFQMNYKNGRWTHLKKYRPLN